jgi:hypothetical protein
MLENISIVIISISLIVIILLLFGFLVRLDRIYNILGQLTVVTKNKRIVRKVQDVQDYFKRG